MSKALGIAFKLTIVIVLLGILGVSIGVLIVSLNIQNDYEATTEAPPSTTPAPTTKYVDPNVDPNFKNIPDGPIIATTDTRYAKFNQISNLFESWMNTTIDPCDDFYHYVCGKGQNTGERSPFDISKSKDNQVTAAMWKVPAAYWTSAPLPVKQMKWIYDKCQKDDSFTVEDQQAQQKKMMQDLIDYTKVDVPFFVPTTKKKLDKVTLSKLTGYTKGAYGAFVLLTAFVSTDFKAPDTAPYITYIDQPLPMFIPDVYTDANYEKYKPILAALLAESISNFAFTMGVKIAATTTMKMAGDMVDFDRLISNMQQDPIVRRQVERNYNPYTLAELNTKADQFDWVAYLQSTLTLLGDNKDAKVTDQWRVIIMEEDITLNQLNSLIKKTDPLTLANYIYFRGFDQITGSVPAPPKLRVRADPLAKYRATFSRDKRTLTGMLRKPLPPMQANIAAACSGILDNILPWAASRMYVDSDIPDKKDRQALKDNVAEIANWIFFGFRSQLDQLNWMDEKSKQGAFDKLNKIQLNVAFPDWVADDAKLTAYYDGLDINENDNYMNQRLKLTNYFHLQEVLPIVTEPARDRGDFSSFIGITNAWYQPQMNSITFPEGILQEPFYSPDFPLATIFGGLGAISGHELTHGFDDQGVQWDGIGALNAWMSEISQKSFNSMAQCVIDEYSSFCPFPGVCVNGENTQGENIADNGGIQAAYKALKAYESLNGADPRLPGFGSSFTSDQLFFLTFAQTWCDQDESEAGFESQIRTDVHSPAIYRVLGTIQNFPAFKNAFNCPADTPYTPTKHCDVWTSKPF
ncbi:hypothetical protein PFISCL1PPCAC_28273 [Pristionchus fissidentatus]|uniref:Peptidase n=1 Tax=Pristionchus fissidentatus TaxID=1538716 RepID=A0AAV5WX66_9BILA|nr:hypothetical protein PFISCL1PPCAC_28273 [Pristionchus fissidentatus]